MNADQYSPYGAGKLAGSAEERQRIIKLLEQVAVDEDGCFSERMPETLIALIKGENK